VNSSPDRKSRTTIEGRHAAESRRTARWQRIGKPVQSIDAKRRRRIRQVLAAWIGIVLVAAFVRACAIRTGIETISVAKGRSAV